MKHFRPRIHAAGSLFVPLLFLLVACDQIAKPTKSDDNSWPPPYFKFCGKLLKVNAGEVAERLKAAVC
jgi:hypothetical protein